MKKILLFFAIILVAFSVSACTSKTDTASQDNLAPKSVVNDQSAVDQNSNSADTNNVAAPVDTSAISDINQVNQDIATETPVQTPKVMSPDKQENLLKTYSQAIIKTSLGNITVKFYGSDSPITVNNFLNLAKAGFYSGTKFHRVIKDFMIQGGDPLSKGTDSSVWGTGGPGYKFDDEVNSRKLVLGSLAMANSGPNTNGSQFFIVTASAPLQLQGYYTNFGEVVSGMEVVKSIEATPTDINDRPVTDVIINSVELVK
jgi:cyclophilin family peptidyl-prolyl cis-trans isomerase